MSVVDADGFRPNVGIVVANDCGQVLWARRIGQDAWQFPQGGINHQESVEEALYRELNEEVGLNPEAVEILACTNGWLRYMPHPNDLAHPESHLHYEVLSSLLAPSACPTLLNAAERVLAGYRRA